jgi:hypothetical protein
MFSAKDLYAQQERNKQLVKEAKHHRLVREASQTQQREATPKNKWLIVRMLSFFA